MSLLTMNAPPVTPYPGHEGGGDRDLADPVNLDTSIVIVGLLVLMKQLQASFAAAQPPKSKRS
jgi:hypothetical protein